MSNTASHRLLCGHSSLFAILWSAHKHQQPEALLLWQFWILQKCQILSVTLPENNVALLSFVAFFLLFSVGHQTLTHPTNAIQKHKTQNKTNVNHSIYCIIITQELRLIFTSRSNSTTKHKRYQVNIYWTCQKWFRGGNIIISLWLLSLSHPSWYGPSDLFPIHYFGADQ